MRNSLYKRRLSKDLGLLTNSPASAIRWRRRDYGEILRAELELLAAMPHAEDAEEWLDAPWVHERAMARARGRGSIGRPSSGRGG